MSNVSKTAVIIIPEKLRYQFLGLIDYLRDSTDNCDLNLFMSRIVTVLKTSSHCYYLEGDDYSQYQKINRSPFGRFKHQDRNSKTSVKDTKQQETGMLDRDLDGCSARNLDLFSRVVLCELENGVIGVVNILSHYDHNVFSEQECKFIRRNLENFWKNFPELHKEINDSTNNVLFMLYDAVGPEVELDISNLKKFNKRSNHKIFPVDLKGLLHICNANMNSIISNQNNIDKAISDDPKKIGDTKANIKKSKNAVLDIVDTQLYRTLKNLFSLSQYIANRYPDGNVRNQLVTLFKKTTRDYRDFLPVLVNNEKYFDKEDTVVSRALKACTAALDNSLMLNIGNDLIISFMKDFTKNMKDDIKYIQKQIDKNLLQLEDLSFSRTEAYIVQFQHNNLNISQSRSNTQTKLMDQLEKRNRGR